MTGREERAAVRARAGRWAVRLCGIGGAALALALVGAGPSTAPAQEVHVRGVIRSVDGDAVTVVPADGRPEKLDVGGDAHVGYATRADPGAIAKGAYVGTAAVPAPDGTLRALEVHVFPDAMRGTGEGRHPWDAKPGSTMTNATVAGASGAGGSSSMTNANVAEVSPGAAGQRLTLSYHGGQSTVVVPPGTPVVRIEPADRSALAAGQHVFAAGARQPDGTVRVTRMYVGKGGTVPPM